jgi:hypothetical protein
MPTLPAKALKPSRFPWRKYKTITAYVYEYLTDEHREPEGFDIAGREVRKQFELGRRKRRPA